MTKDFAAIFDWDGVVIDSARQHEKGWERLAEETGRRLPPDHFKKSFGMKNEAIIPTLLDWTQDPDEVHALSRRKEALYREIVLEDGISPLPGVAEFLDLLRDAGIPCAIGSSTHRRNIEAVLEGTGLRGHFAGWVTAEDVDRGKPDPEVFLKCAECLGAKPERCVVFEDAHVGIEAARRAGMKVVAVATTHPRASLRDADRIVDRLDELGLETLEALFGADPA